MRRQHVGLNQRTRLVRASDLAALTPIIDPAGAITTERSRLDLTSIPAQQAQIKASQQTLLAQLDQLQHQLYEEALTRERLLTEQWTKNQEIIAALRSDMLTNVIQQQDALTQQRKEIDTTLAQQRVALEHAVEALAAQTNRTFAELTQSVTAIAERLEALTRQWQESTQQHQQRIDELVDPAIHSGDFSPRMHGGRHHHSDALAPCARRHNGMKCDLLCGLSWPEVPQGGGECH